MEATTPPTPPRPRKARSPSYPGIDLETALQRARMLYERERTNAALVDAILHHWGYKPNSGAALVHLAALKKFGLLQDEGSGKSRRGRLTPLALDIILDERDDSPDRAASIARAALEPTVHAELWEKYGPSLPESDAPLRFYLTRERAFTDPAAQELIREFRN